MPAWTKPVRKNWPGNQFLRWLFIRISGRRAVAQTLISKDVKSVSGVYAKEVALVKKWLPLMLLIVFTVISITALSGLARNLAQKRTLFSDPLYRVVWKKKKPYRIAKNLTQASGIIITKK